MTLPLAWLSCPSAKITLGDVAKYAAAWRAYCRHARARSAVLSGNRHGTLVSLMPARLAHHQDDVQAPRGGLVADPAPAVPVRRVRLLGVVVQERQVAGVVSAAGALREGVGREDLDRGEALGRPVVQDRQHVGVAVRVEQPLRVAQQQEGRAVGGVFEPVTVGAHAQVRHSTPRTGGQQQRQQTPLDPDRVHVGPHHSQTAAA